MKITKEIEQNVGGKSVKIEVAVEREITEKVNFADGWNIPSGKETFESVEVKFYINGELSDISRSEPRKIDRNFYKNYDELVKKGIYSRIGNRYITETTHNLIMATIEEIKAEMVSAEYDSLKKAEAEKEEALNKALDNLETEPAHGVNGYCRKCHSYCDGDCEEN